MRANYPKLAFAVAASVYFLWIAYDPMLGSFLDLVDLPIHEAGHLIFRPLGEFPGVAGGTLLQLIIPAAFVAYFAFNGKKYSAAIVFFWVGQSLLNIYVYAADAVVMQLVLLGGLTGSEGGFHDWNYMLSELGLLPHTKAIAGMIRLSGTITIICAGFLAVAFSFVKGNVRRFEEI